MFHMEDGLTYGTESACSIRRMARGEYHLLRDFLYDAVFVPDGAPAPDRSIVELPELRLYVDGFGERHGDACLVAECDGRAVGAVWCRMIDGYGHVDDSMPSLAISVKAAYRRRGIGRRLLAAMLSSMRREGFRGVSLSVRKANFAVGIYLGLGFEVVRESADEYVMACRFCRQASHR